MYSDSKNSGKKKKYRLLLILCGVFTLFVAYLLPKPIVRNSATCEIVSIRYREAGTSELQIFYPIMGLEIHVDEESLFSLLHKHKAIGPIMTLSSVGHFPVDAVTLFITVVDKGMVKTILLGEINYYTKNNSQWSCYRIVNSSELLYEALEILGIHQ